MGKQIGEVSFYTLIPYAPLKGDKDGDLVIVSLKQLMGINKDITKAIYDLENTREYTPREDMYGVGYDQAKRDLKKKFSLFR